jgi:hypothetical protein
MLLMGLSMIAVLYASNLSGEPSRTADHYEGTVNQDHLACIDRADAVRFVHFHPSDEFPTFETFLHKMQETGRCVSKSGSTPSRPKRARIYHLMDLSMPCR